MARRRGARSYWLPLLALLAVGLQLLKAPSTGRQAFVAARHCQPRSPRTCHWAGQPPATLLSEPTEVEAAQEQVRKSVEQAEAALAAAEVKLKRAQAFKLPDQDQLRLEVDALRASLETSQSLLDKSSPGRPVETKEPVAELSTEEATKSQMTLSEKLSWDNLKDMSNEERLQLTQEIGPAFGASVGIVAVCYWSISLPLLLNAYHESTGEWPKFEELFSLENSGKTAGAVAGVFAMAALLKPLRIAAAVALTPWTADNVVPLLPAWLGGAEEKKEEAKK